MIDGRRLLMRAEVKHFEWSDPEAASELDVNQSAALTFIAGPLGEPGEETFDVTVRTPEALRALVDRDGVVIGRHFLFVSSVSNERVEDFIRDRLRRLDGDTWHTLAEKIGRIGFWEFEDYTTAP
jgi:hypothetical protein